MWQPRTVHAEVSKLYNELLDLGGEQQAEIRTVEWRLRKLKRPGGPLAVDVALMQSLAQRGAVDEAVDIARRLCGAVPAMGPDEAWTYAFMCNGLLLIDEASAGLDWAKRLRMDEDLDIATSALACFSGMPLEGAPWRDRFEDAGLTRAFPQMMQIVREELVGKAAFCSTEVIDGDPDLEDQELPGLSVIGFMAGPLSERRSVERRVHERLRAFYSESGLDVVEALMAFHVTLLPIEAYRCLKKY